MPARILLLCGLLASVGCGSGTSTGPVSAESGSAPAINREEACDQESKLGVAALDKGDLPGAEQHFSKALASARLISKPNYQVVHGLNNLARVHVMQGKLDAAEPLYTEALLYIQTKLVAPQELVTVQFNLAQLYQQQGKLDKAKPLYARAFQVFHRESNREMEAQCLFELGVIDAAQGNLETSAQFFKMCLTARELTDGLEHPRVADVLEPYAKVLRALKRDKEAAENEARLKAIRDKK